MSRADSCARSHLPVARPALVFLCLLLAITACDDTTQPRPIDENGGTTWSVADPEALGFDPEALEAVRAYAFRPEHHTQAVLIIRHGQIAAEWYREEVTAGSWATSWSVAKSFASTLIGIAIDEGLIPSVDEPVTTWIPEWRDTPMAEIRLRHVLAMTTGLDYTETYDFLGDNDVRDMLFESDQLAFALEQTSVHPPGQVWYYNSANTMLLSRVLEAATGMSAGEYARRKLFEPLQFSKVEWWQDGAGHTLTYCCIDTTPRDFARLGQLYLQRGLWAGRRIVSEAWIDASLTPSNTDYPGYGFQWWLNTPGLDDTWTSVPTDVYAAIGRDEQLIVVFPAQDMVVVRNSWYVKPDHPPVAPEGLLNAGLFIHGLGPTGSKGPDPDTWDDDTFLGLVYHALLDQPPRQ